MTDIKVLVEGFPVGRLTEFNATSPRVAVPIYETGMTEGPFVMGISEFQMSATMPGEKPPSPPPRNRAERRKQRKGG